LEIILDSDDDFHPCCQNASQRHHKQSFSGLCSDEGLTLKTSALELFTAANLP